MGDRTLMMVNSGRGEKYKLKVGKALVTAGNFSDFGEKKATTNYNEEDGDQYDDDNDK